MTNRAPVVDDDASLPRPRIRFGAIAWGTIVGATAAAIVVILIDPVRRRAFLDGMLALEPGIVVLLAVLVVGALVLLLGLLAALRRAQTARAKRVDSPE